MKKVSLFILFFVSFLLIVGALSFFFITQQKKEIVSDKKVLRVLTYSSFIKEWGPGPELARLFEEETGIQIKWEDVNNAGLIVDRLKSKQIEPDAVIGLDLLAIREVQHVLGWKKLNRYNTYFSRELSSGLIFEQFLPMDWSPMTFIYKKKGPPVQKMDDLLNPDYANSLGLQDPNTSATGFYFLAWIFAVKGPEEGTKYLKSLKNSIRVVSPTWSTSYSLFQNDLSPLVFSFFTSPLYHHLNEKDFRYQPIYFDEPYIFTVEYMAIPENCQSCEEAQLWVEFLLRMSSQKIIMEKNFMLPSVAGVRQGTVFDFAKSIQLIKSNQYLRILDEKNQLLEKWNQLGI